MPLELPIPQQPLIQGDARCHAIAAASIIAKVYRDQMMRDWDKFYPEYGLANHKGYPTPEHMAAIRGSRPDAAASAQLRAGAPACAVLAAVRRSPDGDVCGGLSADP